jgi:DNA-binding cell septation regulator SpoVG
MDIDEISVDLRLCSKAEAKVKAFADVTVPLGADGVIKISGFSVIQSDDGLPRLGLPSRKGQNRYFETVTPVGKVRSLVERAVMAEYGRVRNSIASEG